MILFVEDTMSYKLIPLFDGSVNRFDLNNNPNIVFNISSPMAMGEKLNIIPPYYMDVFDDWTFDVNYARYILEEDSVFIEFFKIIYAHYLGYNVFILVGTDSYGGRVRITDSLMKLIQTRYLLIPRYIVDLDDVPDWYEYDYITNVNGIINLDADKERYIRLTVDPSSLDPDQAEEEMVRNGY